MKDYYKILEVPETASQEVIKASYLKLARRYHPDMNIVKKDFGEAKMKLLNEAYEILGDSAKRQKYDLVRRPVFQPAHFAYYYYNNGTATSNYGIWGVNFFV